VFALFWKESPSSVPAVNIPTDNAAFMDFCNFEFVAKFCVGDAKLAEVPFARA